MATMSRISGPALLKNSSIRSQAACTRSQSSSSKTASRRNRTKSGTSRTEATCCFLNIIRIYCRGGIEVNCTTVLRGTEEGDETCFSVQKKPSELLFTSAPPKRISVLELAHDSRAGSETHAVCRFGRVVVCTPA